MAEPMHIDEFMRIVRRLSNQCWLRYYLHFNGKPDIQPMVLELAYPPGYWNEDSWRELTLELTRFGFEEMKPEFTRGWICRRLKVERGEERADG